MLSQLWWLILHVSLTEPWDVQICLNMFNVFLGVFLRVFVDEISFWIGRLERVKRIALPVWGGITQSIGDLKKKKPGSWSLPSLPDPELGLALRLGLNIISFPNSQAFRLGLNCTPGSPERRSQISSPCCVI